VLASTGTAFGCTSFQPDHHHDSKIQNQRSQRRKHRAGEFRCVSARQFDDAARSLPGPAPVRVRSSLRAAGTATLVRLGMHQRRCSLRIGVNRSISRSLVCPNRGKVTEIRHIGRYYYEQNPWFYLDFRGLRAGSSPGRLTRKIPVFASFLRVFQQARPSPIIFM
jgi:hypothetical protein